MLSAFPANTFTRKMEIYSKMYFVSSKYVFLGRHFLKICALQRKKKIHKGVNLYDGHSRLDGLTITNY